MTDISGAVVLVTGANGGLGTEFVRQALERGASKVYATARTPREWDDERVVPLALDVTDEASVAAVADRAGDTTIVINNAGVSADAPIATGDIDVIRGIIETNLFGAIHVARAFAPVLARNGGGALLDVHSLLSWLGLAGAYSASKAAFWSVTNSLRVELAPAGTHVLGLHLGYTDTPMVSEVDAPKNDPADIVRAAYDGLVSSHYEVLADEATVRVKQALSAPVEALYPQLSGR